MSGNLMLVVGSEFTVILGSVGLRLSGELGAVVMSGSLLPVVGSESTVVLGSVGLGLSSEL